MQKITPFLWFDNNAEEAARFYVGVFKNSKIKTMTHYTGEEPSGKKGSVMTVSFELDGQEFVALNGGPQFKFTEAVSFVVNCETQEEIDYYWDKLTGCGGAFVIIDTTSQQIIGSTRFHGYAPKKSEIEIGWTFLARKYWGGRYNAEMKQLMLAHAFKFVENVILLVGENNIRSQKATE